MAGIRRRSALSEATTFVHGTLPAAYLQLDDVSGVYQEGSEGFPGSDCLEWVHFQKRRFAALVPPSHSDSRRLVKYASVPTPIHNATAPLLSPSLRRSEERRVGKECRS